MLPSLGTAEASMRGIQQRRGPCCLAWFFVAEQGLPHTSRAKRSCPCPANSFLFVRGKKKRKKKSLPTSYLRRVCDEALTSHHGANLHRKALVV